MNPNLAKLQPYPFERLRALLAGVNPPPGVAHVNLSIGEPKHPTPEFIKRAVADNLAGLASYPLTAGAASLREAIADWLVRRYGLAAVDPEREVLPVNGSREALFAFAQTVIDATRGDAVVLSPNPFYQIYEGAALLAGAVPHYVDMRADSGFVADYGAVPEPVLRRTQLVYACSPNNPTGRVMTLDEWRRLFDLSDRYGFAIASDECYSELYFDEAAPPLGALEAARRLGRDGFPRLVVFSSLSKRSNVPGMRSGFVAGDASLLERFRLYRTYHGSAMSPVVQAASEAAWRDEAHVRENRALYKRKFAAALPLLGAPLSTYMPEGGFYFWVRTPIADTDFARELHRQYNVTVLPGSYLGRGGPGGNPGAGHVRVALVATLEESLEGVRRIQRFAEGL
ncbi:MAG: succinyldiaminopimelate transaminase [Burkholderiales bacterium]|nr:succinyldiaminopimelate transaminase [Burkholderiales bacterium]